MKPINFDSQPCNPISSNCVVWQGPDVPCIALCTGDTISDVVAALATELCTVLDTLNVDNYDLSCFNITTCKPKDFIALIDFLTQQICDLQGVTPPTAKSGGCPDCMVSVPECLNAPQPVMNLVEYVNFLATKICSILGDIADIYTQIDQLNIRVTNLETAVDNIPDPVPSMVSLDCAVPTVGTFEVGVAFESFINDFFCNYYNYTLGDITNLEDAILSQCILNTDYTKSDPLVQYGNLTSLGWVNTPGTVADTIRNLWLVVCDLYNQAISTYDVQGSNTQYINTNVITSGSNPTVFTVSSSMIDTGWQYLVVPNPSNPSTQIRIPSVAVSDAAPMVRRIGNMLYFKGIYIIPLGDNTSGNGGNIVNQTVASLSEYNYVAKGYTYESRYATGAGTVEACQILTPYDGVGVPQPAGDPQSTNHGSQLILFNGNNILPNGILGANETIVQTCSNSNILTHELWRIAPCSGNVTTGFAMWSKAVVLFQPRSGTSVANGARLFLISAWNYEQYHRTGSIPYLSTMRNFCSRAVSGEIISYLDGSPSALNGPQGIQATGISVLTGSSVTSVTITNPGLGYVASDPVIFSAPPAGVTATGIIGSITTTFAGDIVATVTITNPGSGYDPLNPPTVTFPSPTVSEKNKTYQKLTHTFNPALNTATNAIAPSSYNQVPKYVHDQDTMDAFQMGGLQFRLDGMTAFIQPCASGPYNTINACPTT